MKVTLVQSGGFGGLRITTTADSETLGPEQAKELAGLVDDAGFFDLPDRIGIPPDQADRFQYRLAVTDGARDKTVRVSEEGLTDPLKSLVRWVEASGTRT
jgi:hypothetical protein